MKEICDFVLDYCRAAGGLVEAPVWGVFEVLLPDDVARDLGRDALLRLKFSEDAQGAGEYVGFGHAMVEAMIEQVEGSSATARMYVNDLKLDAKDLLHVGRDCLSMSNGRLETIPGAGARRELFHYLQVHYRLTILTDEKLERLVPVWLNVQGGFVTVDPLAQHVARVEPDNRWPDLSLAHPIQQSDTNALDPSYLAKLIERGAAGAVELMHDDIERLNSRAVRHLELDRARLGDYYDDIEKDMVQRAARSTDRERRESLQQKLDGLQMERRSKLADAQSKYELRVNCEPGATILLAQPKLVQDVVAENKHVSIRRSLVWDPLRRTLESWICDSCSVASLELVLCAGGHIICKNEVCRAPQCVDCKRVYCRLCSEQLSGCSVCKRPVCRTSMHRCKQCGQGTCERDKACCRRENAAPSKLAAPVSNVAVTTSKPDASKAAAPKPGADKGAPAQKAGTGSGATSAVKAKAPTARTKQATKQPPKATLPVHHPLVQSVRPSNCVLEVVSVVGAAYVSARVFKPDRALATREWRLSPQGITIDCKCEKGADCKANDLVLYAKLEGRVQQQMVAEVHAFAREYKIAQKNLLYFSGQPDSSRVNCKVLQLDPMWFDREALLRAHFGFEKLRQSRLKR